MKKYALVLAGGSIKGCWQAGAIQYVTEKFGLPDAIYGISVGSLNATLLAQTQNGIEVTDFWLKNILKPSDIVRKRKWYEILWQELRKDFQGYLDTAPLRKLVDRVVDMDLLSEWTGKISIGMTDIASGDIVYCTRPQGYLHKNWCDILMSSTAIPIVMPGTNIGGIVYFDGGIRDIAPLPKALRDGYTDIIVIACSPEKLGKTKVDGKEALQLLLRTLDILTNEGLNNDINAHKHIGPETDMMHDVSIVVIRPDEELDIDIEKFTHLQVIVMNKMGFEKAKQVLG